MTRAEQQQVILTAVEVMFWTTAIGIIGSVATSALIAAGATVGGKLAEKVLDK